jgi:Ca2+-binding RTX toxin-like protein
VNTYPSTRDVSVGMRILRILMTSFILMALMLNASVAPGPVRAAPAGQGFTLNAGDMRFILKQIKIAERHATREGPNGEPVPGSPLVGPGQYQVPHPLVPYGLRTVDGSYNNLIDGQSKFGASGQKFPRLGSATFRTAEVNTLFPDPYGPPAGQPTSYSQKRGSVVDSHPRIISNLIVDQTVTNPAAIAAAAEPHRAFYSDEPSAYPCTVQPDPDTGTPGSPEGCTAAGKTLLIPNVTTDFGLSPPYNSWFTLFGQFFDHGLDLTSKSGGTVFVPLKSDDPLIAGPDHILNDDASTPRNEEEDNLPPHLRFMVLTRSTNLPGPDGIAGDRPGTPQDESADDIQEATNLDTPWVDQQQTYTSHASHQVFLRAYALVDGRPVATGKLIEGDSGGMASWDDVKEQAATMLGIQLVDSDALNIPMLATDEYGRFLRGPDRGLPQIVTAGGLVEGNRASPLLIPSNAQRINIAFLDDIAHHAVPSSPGCTSSCKAPDGDSDITPAQAPQPAGTYDDEMLATHFIAGDGRVNENIGLTAIHQVFHSEHNRLVGYMQDLLVSLNLDLDQWRPNGAWNGERLFQAARFVTEMEYQHLVFEEFARKVAPSINPFNVFTQSDTGINPAITAEFAHAVYRFGHSMLTDTVARTNSDGSTNDIPLLDAFLNPPEYYNDGQGGTLTPAQAAGSIVMGMTDQVGNELDEFVTETLRNNLLGLPLDLPTINMTRAREAGIPSLNNLRREIWTATNDAALKPYTSWVDFGLSMKHQNSVINFMAAYGTHPTIRWATAGADGVWVNDPATSGNEETDNAPPTLISRREAATRIFNADFSNPETPTDSMQFAHSTGPWANDGTRNITGVDEVDLWVGGLAESQNLFGGLLGSTFNYVFERQLTDLQDGDRLYYLSRTSGLNLRTQLEGNSFAELLMRNTTAHSLKADPFSLADCEFELANLPAVDEPFTSEIVPDDPSSECNESTRLIRMPDGTIRYRQANSEDPPGLNAQNTFNGTDAVNRVHGGVDNDTFWGNEGNDRFEGNDGSDVALGGEGDDIFTDLAGDDILKGGPGNDAIDTGPGLDVGMAGPGNDFLNGGLNDNDSFADEGNDLVISGGGPDTVFGGGGDDWEEGGNGNDLLQGDSGAPFFDDINDPGHDVLIGGSNEDDYDAEGGDDIMVAGHGIERNHGTAGFDWAIHARSPIAADSDLTIHIQAAPGQLADRFLLTEALSGWDKDDVLKGDQWVPFEQDVELHLPWGANALTGEGIDRIAGLRKVLYGNLQDGRPGNEPCVVDPELPGDEGEGGPPVDREPNLVICGFGEGNILLGGGGSDQITGRGANDTIDGDAWLNVRLVATDREGDERSFNALNEMIADVFSDHNAPNHINPGNVTIVREIRYGRETPDPTPETPDIDTAVFIGPKADYDIDKDVVDRGDGPEERLVVTHARNLPIAGDDDQGINFLGEGSDTLWNMERLQFADQTVEISAIPTNTPATGTVTITPATPTEDVPMALTNTIADADGIATPIVFTWEAEMTPGGWSAVATGPTFTPGDAVVGKSLRVVATFMDGDGVPESVSSAATPPVVNVNDAPVGTVVLSDPTPTETILMTADSSGITDADGLIGVTFNHQWQQSGANGNGGYSNIGGATSSTFTPTQAQVNRRLRVVVTFVDNHGTTQTLTSAATVSVTGDYFTGTNSGNTWTGTAGDDIALGGGGNDTLNGGSGDDDLSGQAGNDTVNGQNGNDTIRFSGTGDGFDDVNGGANSDRIAASVANTTIGLDSVTAIELITGSPAANSRVVGSSAANTINLSGVTLVDIVFVDGAGGNDTITGSSAADVILGGSGNDSLTGGDGDDRITGGSNNDTMNGGGGSDRFLLATGFGVDVVNGFDANPSGGQDFLDVTSLGITSGTFGSQVAIAADPAGGTRVTIGGSRIRLASVSPSSVTASDFVLAP